MKDLKVDWRRWTPTERAVAVLIAVDTVLVVQP